MSTSHSLQSLKQEFAVWRMKKKSLRSPVPVELRRKVLALRAHIDDTRLFSALDIRPTMLESWIKKRTNNSQENNTPVEFVTLPTDVIQGSVESVPSTQRATGLKLSCDTPNGNHWCLQGDANTQQLTAFIQSINAISGGAK